MTKHIRIDFEIKDRNDHEGKTLVFKAIYVGTNPHVIETMNKYKTPHLAYVTLSVFDKPHMTTYEEPATVFVGTYESDVHLWFFYNDMSGFKFKSTFDQYAPELGVFKGLAFALLVQGLCYSIQHLGMTFDKLIVLEASGGIGSYGREGMVRLVSYYNSLGFEVIYPDLLEYCVSSRDAEVPMRGAIGNVIAKCMEKTCFDRFRPILPFQECTPDMCPAFSQFGQDESKLNSEVMQVDVWLKIMGFLS